jgi:hypothetical protein
VGIPRYSRIFIIIIVKLSIVAFLGIRVWYGIEHFHKMHTQEIFVPVIFIFSSLDVNIIILGSQMFLCLQSITFHDKSMPGCTYLLMQK